MRIVVAALSLVFCMLNSHTAYATFIFDAHNDLPLKLKLLRNADFGRFGLDKEHSMLQTDIPRLRKSGIKAQFWSANVPTLIRDRKVAFKDTMALIDIVHRMNSKYPGVFELAITAADVKRINAAGKIASLIGVEGGHSIENSLEKLRAFYRRGVRYMTLTHFKNTDWADSGTDEEMHGGLTDFGKDVVREMNRLGMLVDVAHVSEKTIDDVLEISTAPVIVSHAGAAAVTPSDRNLSDAKMRAIAKKGGVIHAIFCARYVNENKSEAKLEDVVKHIDHMVKAVGVDHVGIGSDFEGDINYPDDLDDVSDIPTLIEALKKRGYAAADIDKIMGGNTLRVLGEVDRLAKRTN